jgi:protoporphyrin/coproporphyrin ferrochelatase
MNKKPPVWRHGTAPKTAVVLVNLGTPEAPTPEAVRRYLAEFLGDPRVVEIPRALWMLILHGIILRIRPKKSAAKYATVWADSGSPLMVHTVAQTQALEQRLRHSGHDLIVTWAMRYAGKGAHSIPAILERLRAENATRILLLPMYPQYSASTTATAIDQALNWITGLRNQPELRYVRNFADDQGYIHAVAEQIRTHWRTNPPPALPDPSYRLVMSFHGLPERNLKLGDPYFCECHKTARLVAEALNLPTESVIATFQSRFGKAKWVEPYTEPTLIALAKQGVKRVDILCPGFVADCLETLEEINMEVRAAFLTAGGEHFHYLPCLNEDPLWIKALADLTERHLGGWPTRAVDPATLETQAAQAKIFGALE